LFLNFSEIVIVLILKLNSHLIPDKIIPKS
jgi:hypothetical protein